MAKVCIIEQCYQCRYCVYDSDYSIDYEGLCTYFKPAKDVKNVLRIPKWCPLDDTKGGS